MSNYFELQVPSSHQTLQLIIILKPMIMFYEKMHFLYTIQSSWSYDKTILLGRNWSELSNHEYIPLKVKEMLIWFADFYTQRF